MNAVFQSTVKPTGKELRDDRSREDFPQVVNSPAHQDFCLFISRTKGEFHP